jgi:AsmA protein
MDNLFLQYRFKNNRFEIIKMTADAGKGTLDLNSLVDLTKPGYTYSLESSLDSLHAEEFINSLFPKAKDTVFGILSLNLSLKGAGTLPERIKKNLTGKGDFKITDGKITNSKIPEKLALFLGIEELRTIHIRQATGTVKIQDSIAKLNSMFSSDDIAMNPSGDIGLDETLDLAFDLKLSPELTDKAMIKSNIASYIKDEEGWGRIPLKVSGTFSDPFYSIDVAKAGKRVIEKKAKELMDDLLEQGEGKEDDKGEKPDIQKPLQDILKGVFD